MMDDIDNYEHITLEEYVKYLHIFISHIEEPDLRTEMITHLQEIKEQHHFLETCYLLEATYEPEGSV